MQEKEVKYNLTPTDDPVIAKDYDGFIGPNGEFYMVSPKFTHKPTHNDWADEYCSMLMEKKDGKEIINNEILYGGSNKYLIDGLGFIYYSHSMQHDKHPIIVYPKRFWFKKKKKVTSEQRQTLFYILYYNNELEYFPEDFNDMMAEESLSNYEDDFIKRLIEEERSK